VEININFEGLIEEWRVGVADIIELEKRRQQQQREKNNGLDEEKLEVLKKGTAMRPVSAQMLQVWHADRGS
jgi:hypothetical protein